jgi:hypothetical protein
MATIRFPVKTVIVFLFCLFSNYSIAQLKYVDLAKAKIKQLAVFVGRWEASRKFLPVDKPVVEEKGEMNCYYLLDSTCIQCELQFEGIKGSRKYLQTIRFLTDSMKYECSYLYNDFGDRIVSMGEFDEQSKTLTQFIRLVLPDSRIDNIEEVTRFTGNDHIYFQTGSDLHSKGKYVKDYECIFKRKM